MKAIFYYVSIIYKNNLYLAYLQTDEELFVNTPKIRRLLVKKFRTAFNIYFELSKQQKDKNI